MERWQDSRTNYAWWGFTYLAACAIVLIANVSAGSAHPFRNTLLFGLAVAVGTLAMAGLFALVFAPLLTLVARLTGKRSKEGRSRRAQGRSGGRV